LKWTRRNFLPSSGDADDYALSPAAMAGFEGRAHQIDVADAFESVIGAADLIGAAFRHVDEVSNEIAAEFGWVDEMRHAEALAPRLLIWIHIDADNHTGADQTQTLDDV
jgi:hypothetical protein